MFSDSCHNVGMVMSCDRLVYPKSLKLKNQLCNIPPLQKTSSDKRLAGVGVTFN